MAVFRVTDVHSPTCEYCGGRRVYVMDHAGKPLFAPCHCIFRLEAS